MLLDENSQWCSILVCDFFTSKHYRSKCRSRWENLDCGQYPFQPIKFVNLVVPSPCETEPYNKLRYHHIFTMSSIIVLTNHWVCVVFIKLYFKGNIINNKIYLFTWKCFKNIYNYIQKLKLNKDELKLNKDVKSLSLSSQKRYAIFPTLNTVKWYTKTYYLLTESEVITGKSQTETLMYWPSDSEVNTLRPRSEISL